MRNNLGKTKIRTRCRSTSGLQEFDCLPQCLRAWIRDAALPWRPRSVKRAYNRVLSKTGDPQRALAELDRLQEYQLAKDRVTDFFLDHKNL